MYDFAVSAFLGNNEIWDNFHTQIAVTLTISNRMFCVASVFSILVFLSNGGYPYDITPKV